MKIIFYLIISALLFSGFFTGCIVVKHEENNEIKQEITLSPKPEVKMSDNLVRSYKGDMISFLPQDWFLIDVEGKVSSDIIAVAVNPDYNLSAVFSVMRNDVTLSKIIEKEGLFGLARASMDRRTRKSGGNVELSGKYQKINIGNQEFVKYEFTTTSGAVNAKAVVFASGIDEYYEFALVPVVVNGNPLPPNDYTEDIFQSFLSSIKY
jgi:hypothetical protein